MALFNIFFHKNNGCHIVQCSGGDGYGSVASTIAFSIIQPGFGSQELISRRGPLILSALCAKSQVCGAPRPHHTIMKLVSAKVQRGRLKTQLQFSGSPCVCQLGQSVEKPRG